MYTEFYNLTGKPFQLTPDPDFYVDTKTHHKAMAYLTYGLAQGEGFIIVTGDIGAGKTTLVARLLQNNQNGRVLIGNIVTSQVDGSDLLRLATNAFSLETDGRDKSFYLSALERFLKSKHHEGVRVVLIVDEAQNLPFEALEELRMLSNFQEGGRPLLQTILLGQPEFRQRLSSSPNLEQLRQRTIASHHLEPMQRGELQTYIETRLERCGWSGDPAFTEDAYSEFYEATGGVPRKINNLAGRTLLFASLEERHEVDGALVREVVSDMRADDAVPNRSEFRQQVLNTGGNAAKMANAAPEAAAGDGELASLVTKLKDRSDKHDQILKQLIGLMSDMSTQLDALEAKETAQ